jgi:hypothetical protein
LGWWPRLAYTKVTSPYFAGLPEITAFNLNL